MARIGGRIPHSFVPFHGCAQSSRSHECPPIGETGDKTSCS